jgi:hypothetical protein
MNAFCFSLSAVAMIFLKDCFNRWLNERTLKSPVLHWIIKNRHVRKFAEVISRELIGHKLLKAIF